MTLRLAHYLSFEKWARVAGATGGIPQEFPATSLAFMNDATEVRHGAGRLREEIDTELLGDWLGLKSLSEKDRALSIAITILDELIRPQNPGLKLYALCFSAQSDQLGQWRGCAEDGRGLVLEYDADQLARLETGDGPGLLVPVHYDAGIANRTARAIAEWSQRSLKDTEAVKKQLPILAVHVLPLLAATMKHEGFAEEREYRVLAGGQPDRTVLTPFGPRPQKLFRWPEGDEDRFPRRIILGPGSATESNIGAVRTMLNNQGVVTTTDPDDVGASGRVVLARSSIPYLPT